MMMVYNGNGNDDERRAETPKVSQLIINFLKRYSCTTSNIVYFAILIDGAQSVLLFDRYRSGVVVSDCQRELLLFGNQGSKRRSISIGEDPKLKIESTTTTLIESPKQQEKVTILETVYRHHQNLVQFLPAPILERILLYLPDEATANLPKVCCSWYSEIGKKSPHLWTELMKRHGWPTSTIGAGSSVSIVRGEFVAHSTAVRMSQSLLRGLKLLPMSGNRILNTPNDVAILQSQDSECLGDIVKMWSPARILVANKDECSLALYDVVESKAGQKRLKRVIHQPVGPVRFRGSKRCVLIDMDLDDEIVGCIVGCMYRCGDRYSEETWLQIVPREALLECAGAGAADLNESVSTYQVNVLIENYLTASHDFYESGATFCHVTSVSKCHAYGNGYFLLEAAICLSFDQESEEDDQVMVVEKFFLFSQQRGEITWSDDGIGLRESTDGYSTCFRRSGLNEASLCFYSYFSSHVHSITVCENGHVDVRSLSKKCPSHEHHRNIQVLALSRGVVLAETYRDGSTQYTTDFSLISREEMKPLIFPGKFVGNFCEVGHDHLLLFLENNVENTRDDVTDDDNAGTNNILSTSFLIYLPTFSLVGLDQKIDNVLSASNLSVSWNGSSISVCSPTLGILMVAQNISSILNENNRDKKFKKIETKRKKKASKRKSNSGVDGFARGMR